MSFRIRLICPKLAWTPRVPSIFLRTIFDRVIKCKLAAAAAGNACEAQHL